MNKKPRIALLGLNPHCETILRKNEDQQIISPVVKKMKKNGYKINGPIPSDTAFIKDNRKLIMHRKFIFLNFLLFYL